MSTIDLQATGQLQSQPAATPAPPSNVYKCTTFAQFLTMLQNGKLHQDLSAALPEIAAALENHSAENGGKAKGKLKLVIDFTLKKGVYEIGADFDVTLPQVGRDTTVAWATTDNFFSPQNPAQVEMFGPRAIRDPYAQGGSGTAVRDA